MSEWPSVYSGLFGCVGLLLNSWDSRAVRCTRWVHSECNLLHRKTERTTSGPLQDLAVTNFQLLHRLMTSRQHRHHLRVKMKGWAALGSIVSQPQARWQTVGQVKDDQNHELLLQNFSFQGACEAIPSVWSWVSFLWSFPQKLPWLCLATQYKRLFYQDDSTKLIVQVRWFHAAKLDFAHPIANLHAQFSIGSEYWSLLAVETRRDQERHLCQLKKL